MGLKRKRSATTLTSSPSSTTSPLTDHNSTPPPTHHLSLYTASHNPTSHDYTSFSPPEPYFLAGMTQSSSPSPFQQDSIEINPTHLHSRTRKRHRDGRPDEAIIGQRTINLLFNAQKGLRASRSTDSGYNTDGMTDLGDFDITEDENMTDEEGKLCDEAMELAPSPNDGLLQAALPFSVVHRDDYGVPIDSKSPGNRDPTSPVQTKQLSQKSLDSFFRGGFKPHKNSHTSNHSIPEPRNSKHYDSEIDCQHSISPFSSAAKCSSCSNDPSDVGTVPSVILDDQIMTDSDSATEWPLPDNANFHAVGGGDSKRWIGGIGWM